MQIFEQICAEQRPTAVALGFFDGLHKGHRSVIELAADGRHSGLVPLCLTFSQSPKSVVSGQELPLLMTRSDKSRTLEKLGIEQTVFADFTKLMNLSARQFVSEILIKQLNARMLYCGFNYRFGKNAEGDTHTLFGLCREYGIELKVLPPAEDDGEVVSSTLIKQLIANGDMRRANRLLCGCFGFEAQVSHGMRLGRTLGTPTLNQYPPKELVVPKYGVYCSLVTLPDGEAYCGVTNVGIKPTVGGKTLLWETWMPRYSGSELYGESADVRLLEFIRPERRFESLDELRAEILRNGDRALEIYAQIKK